MPIGPIPRRVPPKLSWVRDNVGRENITSLAESIVDRKDHQRSDVRSWCCPPLSLSCTCSRITLLSATTKHKKSPRRFCLNPTLPFMHRSNYVVNPTSPHIYPRLVNSKRVSSRIPCTLIAMFSYSVPIHAISDVCTDSVQVSTLTSCLSKLSWLKVVVSAAIFWCPRCHCFP
jgi:hypothetical protein